MRLGSLLLPRCRGSGIRDTREVEGGRRGRENFGELTIDIGFWFLAKIQSAIGDL